jgi:hypothetical protein
MNVMLGGGVGTEEETSYSGFSILLHTLDYKFSFDFCDGSV